MNTTAPKINPFTLYTASTRALSTIHSSGNSDPLEGVLPEPESPSSNTTSEPQLAPTLSNPIADRLAAQNKLLIQMRQQRLQQANTGTTQQPGQPLTTATLPTALPVTTSTQPGTSGTVEEPQTAPVQTPNLQNPAVSNGIVQVAFANNRTVNINTNSSGYRTLQSLANARASAIARAGGDTYIAGSNDCLHEFAFKTMDNYPGLKGTGSGKTVPQFLNSIRGNSNLAMLEIPRGANVEQFLRNMPNQGQGMWLATELNAGRGDIGTVVNKDGTLYAASDQMHPIGANGVYGSSNLRHYLIVPKDVLTNTPPSLPMESLPPGQVITNRD